jgi:hypothetical protein
VVGMLNVKPGTIIDEVMAASTTVMALILR